jgi:hypothetical protein
MRFATSHFYPDPQHFYLYVGSDEQDVSLKHSF